MGECGGCGEPTGDGDGSGENGAALTEGECDDMRREAWWGLGFALTLTGSTGCLAPGPPFAGVAGAFGLAPWTLAARCRFWAIVDRLGMMRKFGMMAGEEAPAGTPVAPPPPPPFRLGRLLSGF